MGNVFVHFECRAFQRIVFLSFAYVILAFGSSGTLAGALAGTAAGQDNPPYARPAANKDISDDGEATFDRWLETDDAAALKPEPDLGKDGHWPGDGHDHSDPTGSLVRVERVGDLEELTVAGINTASGDFKALLLPGTIVHFWASWCGPCEDEFPLLERFYRTHISEDLKAKGIRLITISNDFSADPAARFIKKHGVAFPVYLDTEQETNLAIVGQRGLPSTVLVDAGGRFHRLALGKLDWDFPLLPDILAATATRNPEAGNGARKPVE